MKVAIAGGHGQIALRLARLLSAEGHAVRSLIRNPAHRDDVAATGAEPVLCDLETAEPDAVADVVGALDAVVFAAGAGPGSGPERKWTVDHGGAVKLIEAARIAGVARYVIVSSMGADPDAPGDDTFAVYLRAKGQADAALRASGLAWTIVRPGRLTEDPGTGRVAIGAELAPGEVSRDDVAAVLAAVLKEPATEARDFAVTAGDQPLDAAIAALVGRA